MQKSKILNTIQKYLLNEALGSVKWTIAENEATVHFLTEDKTCRGIVTQKGVELEEGTFGIYDTPKFRQVFSALDSEIELKYHTNHGRQSAIYISDKGSGTDISVDYLLSSLDVIFTDQNPDPEIARPFKEVPNPNVELGISQDFVNRFIKAKNALPDAAVFAINATEFNGVGECEFIINYSTHPTTQIKIKVPCEWHSDMELIAFNADSFKEILLANKDFQSAKIKIYHIYDSNLGRTKGMIEAEFTGDDWHSVYRLNKIELV